METALEVNETKGSRLKLKHRAYVKPQSSLVNKTLYAELSKSGEKDIVTEFNIDKKSAKAWIIKAGQLCRVTLQEGSQVGDWNFWSLHNREEKLYTGKTRQIHASHLTTYDRLWSSMPYLRPLATITADSLSWYGIDEDGASCHDVIGARCDPYMHKLITGEDTFESCHQYLTEAIKPYGLSELDVHDVFNIFMCSGFTADTHEYFIRGSPAKRGDYIEIMAEIDLLTALSACPWGDVSKQCNEKVLDKECFPLHISIRQPEPDLIDQWKKGKESEGVVARSDIG